MTVPVWITPISMVVYTVLLMLLTEFMRRHYRTSMWVWVVSLVTIPLWIINIPGDDWFRWAKNPLRHPAAHLRRSGPHRRRAAEGHAVLAAHA